MSSECVLGGIAPVVKDYEGKGEFIIKQKGIPRTGATSILAR